MTNEDVKTRILAAFRKRAAELNDYPKSMYDHQQAVAIGLLVALREAGLINAREFCDLALEANFVH